MSDNPTNLPEPEPIMVAMLFWKAEDKVLVKMTFTDWFKHQEQDVRLEMVDGLINSLISYKTKHGEENDGE